MPQPARPAAPAALSKNARTVLEKRYLVKDKTGKPTEQPGGSVLARGDRGRRGGSRGTARARARCSAVAEEFYCADDAAPVRAQLADADERRPSARPAQRVLRAAGRGRALQRARTASTTRSSAMALIHQSGGGTGFSLLAAAPEGLDGALDDRRRAAARSPS